MPSSRSILAIALALPAVARAQSVPTELDQVVVTATRTAITVDDALAAVEVIDRDQIERSQARSLPELLRGRAGVTLVNQGGLGKVSTLFLRGTESDHVLLLVDGVRVGSATSGLAALQDIPVALIDRVEIVRGPRSSLYGSEAIGGVIQVFTRRAGAGVAPHLHLAAGSHALREAGAGVDARGAHGWLGIDGSWQDSGGINACRGVGAPSYAGCGMDAPDPDRDGYRNRALSLRGGLDAGDALVLEGNALRSEGHNAYDGDPAWGLPDNSDTVQQVVGARVRYTGTRVTVQLGGGRDADTSTNFQGTRYTDRFGSTRDSGSLQGDLRLAPAQLLTVGLDWTRDRGEVRSAFAGYDRQRGNRAGFVQYQGRFGRHDLQAARRHDDNDQFGGHDTGSIAWGLALPRGLRLTASIGTAFKAPSFNELYYPYYGNPGLQPERSRSAEVGVARTASHWHWQLSLFQTAIEDLITYDTTLFSANNLDRARIRGGELALGGELAGWALAAQASVLDPRNRSDDGFDNLLPRRTRRSGRVDIDRTFGDWRLGASWVAEGWRYDDVANTLRVGGHATLDLRAERSLAAGWTLQAQVRNAAGQRYETAAYYNQPGREFTLGLRYRPAP